MVRNVNPGALVLLAPQHISAQTFARLDIQVDDAITRRTPAIDLDLSATQMIDSAGLNWLLNAQSRLAAVNISLRLFQTPRIIIDVLHATRLDTRFAIVPVHSDGGVERA